MRMLSAIWGEIPHPPLDLFIPASQDPINHIHLIHCTPFMFTALGFHGQAIPIACPCCRPFGVNTHTPPQCTYQPQPMHHLNNHHQSFACAGGIERVCSVSGIWVKTHSPHSISPTGLPTTSTRISTPTHALPLP